MSRVMVIANREIKSLFFSPIAYVVLFLFMFFMGWIFVWRIFVPGKLIELRDLADFSRFGLFFVIPLLTMSIFSDEYRSGRIEMIRTSPITELDLVLGKFLGAMSYYMVLLGATIVLLLMLLAFGRPDFLQVLACYFGMTLMGAMFVSVGLFFSSMTRDQIVAALLSFITLGVLTISSFFTQFVPGSWKIGDRFEIPIRPVFAYMTVGTHIEDFAKGSVELTNIAYFGGFTLLFLFWTYIRLESNKWR